MPLLISLKFEVYSPTFMSHTHAGQRPNKGVLRLNKIIQTGLMIDCWTRHDIYHNTYNEHA